MRSDPSASEAGTPALSSSYGGFRLGDMHLALPMTVLREVMALDALRPIPCPAACVIGGVDLRGVVVPVVDLRVLLGMSSDAADSLAAGANVVIMVHAGRLVGLLAHAVTGIFTGADGSLVRGSAGDAMSALFAGSIRRGADPVPICLISPDAVFALPELPLLEDPEPERLAVTEAGIAHAQVEDDAISFLLLRCGRVLLAIDAVRVQATIANPLVEPSALAMGACRGVVEYGGQRIAAVDLHALCGFGGAGNAKAAGAVVLPLETGSVALLIDEVIDIVRVPAAGVVALSPLIPSDVAIFTGALPAQSLPPEIRDQERFAGVHFLRIDAAALQAVPAIVALGQMNTPAGGRGASAASVGGGSPAPAGTRSMVCYAVAGAWATPLEQIAEILPFRADSMHFGGGRVGGLVVDRGRSIALVCLGTLLDPAHVPGSETAVLVVQSDQHWVGFAVQRLTTIDTAHWEPELPPARARLPDVVARTAGRGKLALFGAGNEERMLRVLDLRLMARILLEEDGTGFDERGGLEAPTVAATA